MTRAECLAVIEAEHLTGCSLFRGKGNPNDIVARSISGKFMVARNDADGRIIKETMKIYDSEEDAIDDFLTRVLFDNSCRFES